MNRARLAAIEKALPHPSTKDDKLNLFDGMNADESSVASFILRLQIMGIQNAMNGGMAFSPVNAQTRLVNWARASVTSLSPEAFNRLAQFVHEFRCDEALAASRGKHWTFEQRLSRFRGYGDYANILGEPQTDEERAIRAQVLAFRASGVYQTLP